MGSIFFCDKQVGIMTWRGQDIPVKADFNAGGQPASLPRVMIADMPPAFREAVRRWLQEERIIKIGMPPSGDGYYAEDIQEFIAWKQEQAKLADED